MPLLTVERHQRFKHTRNLLSVSSSKPNVLTQQLRTLVDNTAIQKMKRRAEFERYYRKMWTFASRNIGMRIHSYFE